MATKTPWVVGLLALTAAVALMVIVASLREHSLSGEYYYNLVEVRSEGEILDYCDGFGTMWFDGEGGATISGTRRCSESGVATDSGEFTYTIEPDQTVLIKEAGYEEIDRARILDGGRILLMDGTSRPAQGSVVLIHHGVAVRL